MGTAAAKECGMAFSIFLYWAEIYKQVVIKGDFSKMCTFLKRKVLVKKSLTPLNFSSFVADDRNVYKVRLISEKYTFPKPEDIKEH